MNYTQALDYLFSQLPMFHRVGAPAYKANLDNTIALSEATGFPYRNFKTVHVAGTNGKGSVSHMLASVLQESGFKTGLFTSPHLEDFRERIKVNGEMISKEYVTEFVLKHTGDFEKIKPSFFEMTFALGMCYFSDMDVDIAVIETGMGGRLDSTNVITPEISIITNIGYDHMQFLGNTLEAIAFEKAGIIKPGVPVVIGESNSATDDVFINRARELNSSLIFADKLTVKEIESPLLGEYQLKNIQTVFAATGILQNLVTGGSLITGIRNTIINTGLQGRWQTLAVSPLTICDIGHNSHGLKYVISQIKKQKYNKLHFVFGAVNDKDLSVILKMLPQDAFYYFCKPDIPRGLDSSELTKQALAAGLEGTDCVTVESAYNSALQNADINDMIFIGGSTFVVAEVLPLFNHKK